MFGKSLIVWRSEYFTLALTTCPPSKKSLISLSFLFSFFGGVFAIVLHIFLYLKMKRVMSFIWKALHRKYYFFSRLYMIRYDARECKIFFCESPSQSPFLFLFLRSLDCVNRTEAGSNRQRQNKWSHTSSWELRTGKCEIKAIPSSG